ncbi:MAG: ABC transporter permease, partial [Oscillospiraceae bacterium]
MKKETSSYPYLIWMSIFIVVPILLVIYFSFTDKSGNFTIDNILKINDYIPVFYRSILLAVISTAICLLIGYPIAYILSKTKTTSQRTLLILIMLPMWMNFLLRTYAWMTLLENTGLINKLLIILGFTPLKIINTPVAVVIGMIYNYLPFMILPLYSVMVKLDKSLIEAAQD